MNRSNFLKTGSALIAMSLTGLGFQVLNEPQKSELKFPRYRGFNLLAKFAGWGSRRKFKEDFEIMAEWGFDFVRIPMSYWCWVSRDDWYKINEDVLKDSDEVIELGKPYKVHDSTSAFS